MTRRPMETHMVFIRFEAMPTQAIAARDNVAGACINCSIQADDAIDAERRAREWIAEGD